MIEFEFDPLKSQTNLLKHGIDFNDAQALWQDDGRVVLSSRHEHEPRYLVIGQIDNKTWTAIYAMRNENIRLISVRRSRKMEEVIYEDHNG